MGPQALNLIPFRTFTRRVRFMNDRLNQKRVTKDINELQLPSTCKTEFEDPDDLLNFQLIICPDEGFYRGGRFVFNFKVGNNYPHEPPKVNIMTRRPRTPDLLYHGRQGFSLNDRFKI